MYRSNQLKKTYVQNGRNILNQRMTGFPVSLRYRSLTDTPTLTVSLKAVSSRSKAKITLAKLPWNHE